MTPQWWTRWPLRQVLRQLRTWRGRMMHSALRRETGPSIAVTSGRAPLPDMPQAVRQIIGDSRAALASGALAQPLLTTDNLSAVISSTIRNAYGDVHVVRATRC